MLRHSRILATERLKQMPLQRLCHTVTLTLQYITSIKTNFRVGELVFKIVFELKFIKGYLEEKKMRSHISHT
jgi:hypothetical protein